MKNKDRSRAAGCWGRRCAGRAVRRLRRAARPGVERALPVHRQRLGIKQLTRWKKASLEDINSVHLRDNPELYTVYDDSGVVTMYLTVSRGNDSENTNHSWAEINHYSVYDYETMGVPRYQVNALLQVGDENGPLPGELGYAVEAPNATVRSVARPPVGMLRKTTK